MFDRIAKTLRLPAALLASPALLLGTLPASGQAGPTPVAPAQFDPAEVYFQGYMLSRNAEQLEASEDYAGAAEKLKRAREMFDNVRKYYPSWKPEMVRDRSTVNSESESRIFENAEKQRKKNKSAVAELEGGGKTSGTFIDPAEGVMPLTPGILEVKPLDARQLEDAEAEVKRLNDLLKNSASNAPESSRDISRIEDLKRQNDYTRSQLKAAENTALALRAQLAKAAQSPIQSDLNTLNQRIAGLERERDTMAMLLSQSSGAHKDALARIAILEADLMATQQKHSDALRDLKAERQVSNEVVAGQRAQLQAYEKELSRKSEELGKANERINGLMKELGESKDAFAALRTERDSLLKERDQMSSLLKLNEDGRIMDLIQQNMGLVKNLREANEKVDRLSLDNNTTKDEINSAKNDLIIAKSQINSLHREKREQDKRLEELESRLRGEEASLANGKGAANPEEVNVLREIIRKQLRIQERRRQAKEQLVEAARQMGTQDEELAKAVKLFDSQEIELTPEEQQLIAEKPVDDYFVSPFARDRASVGKSTDELKRDISVLERTAEKSYAAGRFLPTRELFDMIIEQHPGHVPTLCKLGVVDLKLNDPNAAVDKFRRAVELDTNNPYAHRMLGFSLMTMGDLPAAQQNVKHAIELAPDDAMSQLLSGVISERLGNPREAESYYKAAIAADPLPSDPYYNLARLSARAKHIDQARDYYSQALERGALPDPALEQLLAAQ